MTTRKRAAMNENVFRISPIKIGRGAYSASRFLYHAIWAKEDDVLCSACTDINNLILNHISGIFVFDQGVSREELEDMELKNWVYGKSLHCRYKTKQGVVFDENSYFLAVADADSGSLLEIAEKLCLKSEKKAVLVKDRNAAEMFLVSLNHNVNC